MASESLAHLSSHFAVERGDFAIQANVVYGPAAMLARANGPRAPLQLFVIGDQNRAKQRGVPSPGAMFLDDAESVESAADIQPSLSPMRRPEPNVASWRPTRRVRVCEELLASTKQTIAAPTVDPAASRSSDPTSIRRKLLGSLEKTGERFAVYVRRAFSDPESPRKAGRLPQADKARGSRLPSMPAYPFRP